MGVHWDKNQSSPMNIISIVIGIPCFILMRFGIVPFLGSVN